MELRHGSKVMPRIVGALMLVLMVTVTPALLKIDLANIIFGKINNPAQPPQVITKKRIEVPVPQPVSQTDLSGYKHYTDKNGDEVIIVNARYEAKTESAQIQAAPQQKSYQVPPLVPQRVSQTRNVPLQTPPPGNLTSVAMNAAANAHTGVNVFESCRCNNGLATKDNLKQEVLEKCAQPAIRQFTGSSGCREIWLYNFGPNEFMQGICFDGNRVNKVLSLDRGY